MINIIFNLHKIKCNFSNKKILQMLIIIDNHKCIEILHFLVRFQISFKIKMSYYFKKCKIDIKIINE